jgi:PTH1 family peptidyl-tRNA hydrolase
MKLIAGLGNPGIKYRWTRHNIGRRFAQYLAEQGVMSAFVEPKSFMNESGREIAEKVQFYKLIPEFLLVIHDDLDLPFGEMKMQFNRGSAGHHGVESVTRELGTCEYWRLRVGIGPRLGVPGDLFVLQNFTEKEGEIIEKELKVHAKEMVIGWLKVRQER